MLRSAITALALISSTQAMSLGGHEKIKEAMDEARRAMATTPVTLSGVVNSKAAQLRAEADVANKAHTFLQTRVLPRSEQLASSADRRLESDNFGVGSSYCNGDCGGFSYIMNGDFWGYCDHLDGDYTCLSNCDNNMEVVVQYGCECSYDILFASYSFSYGLDICDDDVSDDCQDATLDLLAVMASFSYSNNVLEQFLDVACDGADVLCSFSYIYDGVYELLGASEEDVDLVCSCFGGFYSYSLDLSYNVLCTSDCQDALIANSGSFAYLSGFLDLACKCPSGNAFSFGSFGDFCGDDYSYGCGEAVAEFMTMLFSFDLYSFNTWTDIIDFTCAPYKTACNYDDLTNTFKYFVSEEEANVICYCEDELEDLWDSEFSFGYNDLLDVACEATEGDACYNSLVAYSSYSYDAAVAIIDGYCGDEKDGDDKDSAAGISAGMTSFLALAMAALLFARN